MKEVLRRYRILVGLAEVVALFSGVVLTSVAALSAAAYSDLSARHDIYGPPWIRVTPRAGLLQVWFRIRDDRELSWAYCRAFPWGTSVQK